MFFTSFMTSVRWSKLTDGGIATGQFSLMNLSKSNEFLILDMLSACISVVKIQVKSQKYWQIIIIVFTRNLRDNTEPISSPTENEAMDMHDYHITNNGFNQVRLRPTPSLPLLLSILASGSSG